jgi:hypothetical protein
MADHCSFCDTRRPQGGTNILIINNGSVWLEFCPDCGDKEILTNQDGKHQTVAQVFKGSDEEAPEMVVLQAIAKRNIEREERIAEKKRQKKAYWEKKQAERDAKANSIGNMFPELAKLKEAS